MNSVELWISRLAALDAVIIFALPLINIFRSKDVSRGRSSGAQAEVLRWPVILLITIAVIVAGVVLWKPIPLTTNPSDQLAYAIIGAAFYFPGLTLYLWGYLTLGSMFGVSSAMRAELYEGHRLVEKGPYRYVRHPMYLGVILAAFGALLIFRTWTMLIFAPLLLTLVIRARREDNLLAAEFGDSWKAYARQVPAWMPRSRPDG